MICFFFKKKESYMSSRETEKNYSKTTFVLVIVTLVLVLGSYIWLIVNETRKENSNNPVEINYKENDSKIIVELKPAEIPDSQLSSVMNEDLNMNGKSIINAPNINKISDDVSLLNTSLKTGINEFENISDKLNRIENEIQSNKANIDINMAIIDLKVSQNKIGVGNGVCALNARKKINNENLDINSSNGVAGLDANAKLSEKLFNTAKLSTNNMLGLTDNFQVQLISQFGFTTCFVDMSSSEGKCIFVNDYEPASTIKWNIEIPGAFLKPNGNGQKSSFITSIDTISILGDATSHIVRVSFHIKSEGFQSIFSMTKLNPDSGAAEEFPGCLNDLDSDVICNAPLLTLNWANNRF